jgi:hypothetical protein
MAHIVASLVAMTIAIAASTSSFSSSPSSQKSKLITEAMRSSYSRQLGRNFKVVDSFVSKAWLTKRVSSIAGNFAASSVAYKSLGCFFAAKS